MDWVAGECANELSGGNSRHQTAESWKSDQIDCRKGAGRSHAGQWPQSIGTRDHQANTNSIDTVDDADQLATQASGTAHANRAGLYVSGGLICGAEKAGTTPAPSTVRRSRGFKHRSRHSAASVNQFNHGDGRGGGGGGSGGGDGEGEEPSGGGGGKCASANWNEFTRGEQAAVTAEATRERHDQGRGTRTSPADSSLIRREEDAGAETSRRGGRCRSETERCEPEPVEVDCDGIDLGASVWRPATQSAAAIAKRRQWRQAAPISENAVAYKPNEPAQTIANRNELERGQLKNSTFWARLSNLSRSILQQQQSLSVSSGSADAEIKVESEFSCAFLAPEVLSYLESRQNQITTTSCGGPDTPRSIMTKTSSSGRSAGTERRRDPNNPAGDSPDEELESGKLDSTNAQVATSKRQMIDGAKQDACRKAIAAAAATTTSTQSKSDANTSNKMIKRDDAGRVQRQQVFKTIDSNEIQSDQFHAQQQHQVKLSLTTTNATNTTTTTTTTTTTIRSSSASSLSSCILSESMSTRSNEARVKWSKKMDFLLSIIGFAVDLANIWRFPYLVYKNGGGVFLIPYSIMFIFGGIPLFFLELCLGQYVKKGPITVWNKICPYMKGVGYCSILITWYVSFYYNVLIAWSVYFIYRSITSFGNKMPWEDCDNSWNSPTTCVSISQLKNLCSTKINMTLESCRKEMFSSTNVSSPASEFFVKELSQIDQSSGLEDMGYLRPELVLCLIVVYTLHYFSLFRGLETSGKVVWVTATAPYIILSILMVRGLFLPGAFTGIHYYVSPRLEKLADPQVWIDAAIQVFYSIGVGFGVHLTYASFNSHNNNCYRDCLMTSAVNALTSVYSGLVVFIYLGYMATNMGIDIDKVASEGYSLVFEVYPEALTTLPFARFWSILFFIMLLTLGIDSAMGGLEAVITGLEDEFKFAKRLTRSQLTGLVIVSSFLPALISCTQGGAYTLFWFDIYSAGISLLFSALFETIGVVYCYGLDKFIVNIESMLGKRPQIFYIICWLFISPVFLLVIIVMSIVTAQTPVYRGYTFPDWSVWLGWCLAFSSVAAVPIVAIMTLFSNRGKHKSISVSPSKSPRKTNATGVMSAVSVGSKNVSRKSTPSHGTSGAHHHQPPCRKPMMTTNEANQMGTTRTTSSVINLPADHQHHCHREGSRIEEEML